MPRSRSSGALSIWSYASELREALLRQHLRDRRRQRRLAVVDVTDRPDVHVRLVPDEFFFGHRSRSSFALGCRARSTIDSVTRRAGTGA